MPSILIVDDEKHIVELITVLLEDFEEYKIIKAFNGQEAFEAIETYKPEIVLLDYMMPEMNGLEVLEAVQGKYPDMYIIVMTGKGSERIAVEFMKAGASDYISKPFKADELIEIVENGMNTNYDEDKGKEEHKVPILKQVLTEYTDEITYNDEIYHVYTQDLGMDKSIITSTLYCSGIIRAQKDVDYSDYLDNESIDLIVSTIVKRLHYQLIEKLLTGQLD